MAWTLTSKSQRITSTFQRKSRATSCHSGHMHLTERPQLYSWGWLTLNFLRWQKTAVTGSKHTNTDTHLSQKPFLLFSQPSPYPHVHVITFMLTLTVPGVRFQITVLSDKMFYMGPWIMTQFEFVLSFSVHTCPGIGSCWLSLSHLWWPRR